MKKLLLLTLIALTGATGLNAQTAHRIGHQVGIYAPHCTMCKTHPKSQQCFTCLERGVPIMARLTNSKYVCNPPQVSDSECATLAENSTTSWPIVY